MLCVILTFEALLIFEMNQIVPPSMSTLQKACTSEDPPTDDDVFPYPESRPPTRVAPTQVPSVGNNHIAGGSTASGENSSTEQPMTNDKTMTLEKNSSTSSNDDMQQLLQHVNDRLSQSCEDYKSKVKRVFKELVALQQEYEAVQEIWAPIQRAEQKEAARLDALQVDVDKTMSTMAPFLGAMNVAAPQDGVHNTSETGGAGSF